ncbi:MAG TPA: response regulator [Bacteroidales bacterium]|nr:response regulator [Bacteroidales bacterium]
MNEKPKILIIEDDRDFVAAMKAMLENKGYKVTYEHDTDKGYENLIRERPDIIILDVMFGTKGDSKGFDFANRIKTDDKFRDIPVLMLTAINTQHPFFNFSPETDGEFLPVDSFLDKPVKFEELLEKVEELLKQKKSKWSDWPDVKE